MLSISSQLISRRVLHSFRYNCIKTLQTNANKLEKTLNFNNVSINFEQKLKRLEASLRRVGKVTTSDVMQCLNELSKSRGVRPTTTQSLQLIRTCGSLASDERPETRKEFCEEMFERLSQSTSLDVSHYNQLLRVFVENEFDFNAIEFLEQMEDKGIVPNRVTYVLMIDRFCQTANVSEAIRILEHMRSQDMAVSESVFNSLIVGYGKAGDMETARQTLDLMKRSGIEPSADTYTALLCAYATNCRDSDSEMKMNEVLEECRQKEVELSERDLFKVIKAIALADPDSTLLDPMLNRMTKTVYYNKECLDVINDLLFADRTAVAFKLYETMAASDRLVEHQTVGNPLIRSMIRANVPPKTVIEFCERLQTEGKNESALKVATEMALSSANVADCRTYLKRLSRDQPLRVHYFYPIITKCQNESEILDVLSEDMSEFSGTSYSQLTELFMDYIWPKNMLDFQTFIEKCKENGFSYAITYNSLIRYQITSDRIQEAIHLMSSPNYSSINLIKRDILSALSNAVFRPNPNLSSILRAIQIMDRSPHRLSRVAEVEQTDHFGHFLLSVIRRRIPQTLLNHILKTCDRMNVRLSEGSVNAIRDRTRLSDENEELLNKMKTRTLDDYRGVTYHDFDDLTKPRREMTPEELEGQLIELRSKGMNTRGVLRSLLLSYCRRSKFNDESKNDLLVIESQNRVKKIFAELKESNYEFTSAMYAMLLEFFVNTGDIESALDMKSKISNEFEIDSYKVINLATLYVRNGQIDKAIELIKEENNRKPEAYEGEESNSHLIRSRDMSIYRLLNALIEGKADLKLLKEAFDLCIDYSSLTPTSVMAGPLVKYHILKEDYSGALKEFVNCAENYRITPWKNQLLRYFLENGDQISLQTVIDFSNKIHGEMNTIMELAAVCVEAGKLKQARKLLDTPGLRVKQIKVDNICEQMVREGKVDELEQFIRCSKNVFDVNRDRMLFHLIRGCVKLGSPQKALNCWTLMQEQDIQPSDNTLIFLANYLKQNDISVPFAVPPNPIEPFSKQRSEPEREHQKTEDNGLNKFNAALKMSNIEEAIEIKKSLELEGKSLLMSQNCALIEALLNADRIDEAFDISKSLLESKLFPSPRIIRYLYSKLSSIGDHQRLDDLRPVLPDFLVQNNSFTNALSIAYINSGKAEDLIDNKLLQMKPFPLGAFLRALEVRPDLEERLLNISYELMRESDYHLPLNMVWINCMKKERFEDAKRIYDSCPKLKDFLLFTSLLDSIRENQNIVLAQKLVETVSDSNLTPKSIGVIYSALIDAHLERGEVGAAEDVVVNRVVNSASAATDATDPRAKPLAVEHLNRSTLNRLTKAIREREQREPRFQAPTNRYSATTASDDESSGNSSDEEVVDLKNK